MAVKKYQYLGTAVTYPTVIQRGRPTLTSGPDVIKQSMIRILQTPLGSLFHNPDYGSRLVNVSFEINDEILARMLRFYVIDALVNQEKRARYRSPSIIVGVDGALIKIPFVVIQSNEEDTLVYPFFRGKYPFA